MHHLPLFSHADPAMFARAKVLVRSDLNVPIADGKIIDDYRIVRALPTITRLVEYGAEVTVATHVGEDGTHSVEPLRTYLQSRCGQKVSLLENLRAEPGEKGNDHQFAERVAKGFQFFINDAFGASHREHASIVGIPAFVPSYAGLLMEDEIANLSKAFTPAHPFIAVLGGAKFETKIPLVKRFVDSADVIFVSGALCVDFFKAKGFETGCSLTSPVLHEMAEFLDHPKIFLPLDVVAVKKDGSFRVAHPSELAVDEAILDVGPETILQMAEHLQKAQFILWNGPLGNYEKGFSEATDALAQIIADSGVFSIVGGGDTIASIKKLKLLEKFGFVSTGGGAMLEFLTKGTLPGIEALKTQADCCQ